ncbi:hypothetical protein AcV5_002662 [Taiwanofungus camphoratus]|nr:hypothetical protein AcV5_003493 [Antrodia cinnamomea]KAI0918753.1 hypothetical protein AcV5_002662 [Antrodia cinnamomea]KAI0918864.1 hypothetical protein AcV7_006976 [Antrodia cinnamomea]KAI0934976.1 hypothetical protein AcV7_003899 [Antrodia cinnamomea]
MRATLLSSVGSRSPILVPYWPLLLEHSGSHVIGYRIITGQFLMFDFIRTSSCSVRIVVIALPSQISRETYDLRSWTCRMSPAIWCFGRSSMLAIHFWRLGFTTILFTASSWAEKK